MPILINRPKPARVFEAEIVSRQCKLETYVKKAVEAIKVNEEIITYCSPDSTYAVTRGNRTFHAICHGLRRLIDQIVSAELYFSFR